MSTKWSARVISYLFFCFLVALAARAGVSQAETAVMPIHYREASEVLPMVKTMLSPSGEVVVDEQTNSLVITDREESLQKIRAFLPTIDVPGRMVRVRMRFQEIRSTQDRALSAGGSVSGGGWEITKGRRGERGVTVDIRDESARRKNSSESFINVNSGSSAYIVVGEDIPYQERWMILGRRYAQLVDTVVFRRVETGMEVRPVVTGKVARVDIIPRISYLSKEGEEGTIRFTSAQTCLTVPLGQWVSIGGTRGEEHEVINALLECGRGSSGTSLSILIKVEAN